MNRFKNVVYEANAVGLFSMMASKFSLSIGLKIIKEVTQTHLRSIWYHLDLEPAQAPYSTNSKLVEDFLSELLERPLVVFNQKVWF